LSRQITADTLHDALVDLVDCAEGLLSPSVGRAFVAPGATASWDEGCDGQVWVATTRITPGWPEEQTGPLPCPTAWRAEIILGVLRCVSTVSDSGVLPSAATLIDEAAQAAADRQALYEAWSCCFDLEQRSVIVNEWVPLGPEGGMAGGQWSLGLLFWPCPC
jgi:hypothetical protein